MTTMSETEYLFSYGTLQQDNVQMETYGRSLVGETDQLIGFKLGSVAVSDPDVIRKSGLNVHPVAVSTGNFQDIISGMVFEISQEELLATDTYEASEYERVRTALKSGQVSWVYVLRQNRSCL